MSTIFLNQVGIDRWAYWWNLAVAHSGHLRFPLSIKLSAVSESISGMAGHNCFEVKMTSVLQRLEQQGELVVCHSDKLTHGLARQQVGVLKASVDAIVAEGKIPLILTDVEGMQMAKDKGMDCLTVFLAPASPQVCFTNHLTDHQVNQQCYLLLAALGPCECQPGFYTL